MHILSFRRIRGRGAYWCWFSFIMGFALISVWSFQHLTSEEPWVDPLVISPVHVELTDRVYQESESVASKFTIANPQDRPVTVTAIHTSCTCMVSDVEGGSSPPFTIEPGKSVSFTLKASTVAQPEPVQTYHAVILSECEGRPMPEAIASMSFKVEDPLKAYPPRITAANAPADEPIHRRVYLARRSPKLGSESLSVTSSAPDAIRVRIESTPDDDVDRVVEGFHSRYYVEVSILPQQGRRVIVGNLEVLSNDQPLARIPVECTFDQPYRKADLEEGECWEVVLRVKGRDDRIHIPINFILES